MEIELEQTKKNEKEVSNEINNGVDNSVTNKLQNSVSENNTVTAETQNNFLQSSLGKAVNIGLDLGLRALLPDLIETQVIDIKNIMMKQGFKEGIDVAIKSALDIGKSALGIVTGKFDSISQAHTAVKKGGVLDTISSTLDTVLKTATKNKMLSKDTSNLIKKGKNAIVNTMSNKIEESFMTQIKSTEKMGKYILNWNDYYKQHDLEGMQREYKKIKTQLKELLPIETTLQQARKIENIQTLIQNKNGDFNLSEEELELAKKLA